MRKLTYSIIMELIIRITLLFTVLQVKCDSGIQVQEPSGHAGQGTSFVLMQHVFKLEGKVETKLKHMEEDIEELESKVENLNEPQEGTSMGEDIEKMKSEIKSLSREFENAKSKQLNLEKELLQLQDSNSALKKGITALQEKNSELQNAVSRIQSSGNGITYVRWGRTDCPRGTEIVYKGSVGGSHYKHSGGGANYLCLTDEPEWGYYDKNGDGAYVYGGEYEFGDAYSNGGSNFFGSNLNDVDALCVVCRPPRNSVVMIPGRKSCFAGWTLEYSGYLVSGRYNYAASEFICLDRRPKAEAGSRTNMDGRLFYMVEGRCGSLNCPPYINNRELTCVVCSK